MPDGRFEPDWASAGTTMATFTVTTKDDLVNAGDGVLSLREALAAADATPTVADTIKFDVAAMGGNRIVLAGSQLTIASDVTIDGDRNDDGTNIAISGGGTSRILSIEGSQTDVTLTDLELRDGREHGARGDSVSGGAIMSSSKSLIITRTVFSGNSVYDPYNPNPGGAIFFSGSVIKIADSLFTGNSAWDGGAIAVPNPSAAMTITSSIFQGNRGVDGGAINVAGDVTMTQSSIRDNVAAYYHDGAGGGAIIGGYGLILASCISGNSGYYGGGGIIANDLRVVNSTITNNNVENRYSNFGGGGIFAGNLILINSTITGNNVSGGDYRDGLGGGIRADTLTIANSIVAGNTAAGAGAIPDIAAATLHSNGHNIFGSSVAGAASGDLQNVPTSRLFAGGLADNGGPTLTIALLDDPTNPALGGADPADAPATDQRGVVRPLPAGTDPDIGAFELDQTTSGPTVILGTNRGETLLGTPGDDLMRALGGDDILRGFGGADQLFGGNGNDLLLGKGGLDRVHGGAGADRFALRLLSDAPAGGPVYDEVLDFSRAQHDRIDLSRLDAKGGVPGDQAFTFVGTAEFSAAGQLRYAATADGDFLVSGNVDRDLHTDFALVVRSDLAGLRAGDFIL